MAEEKIVPVSCNKDCGGGCALAAYVADGKVSKIKDSVYKPEYMRGCIKGYRMTDALYSPQRLQKPLIRTGERGSGRFSGISWDEAAGYIAEKLDYYKRTYGASSVMRIGGSGSCRGALHNTEVLARRFLSLYGGYTDTTGNFSSEASDFVKPYMFGTKYIGIDVKTLFASKLLILWGLNPEETRMGAETEKVFKKLSSDGVPFVVIDPRRTPSVSKYGARWFPIQPGTDSALMLAMIYILIRDSKIDYSNLEKYTKGFSGLKDYIEGSCDGIPKSPKWASGICGLDASRIEELAELYAGTKPAALLSGLSVQRTIGGENTDRLGAVLQLATANFGVPGGAPGCGQWNRVQPPSCGKLSVMENPEIKKVPVYQWADAVLEGKKGGFPSDIRMLYNVGGNYVGQGSDTGKSVEAFLKAEFVVTHDYFLTPTARYSDIVLPVTTFLERDDIVFSNSKYLFYSAKAVEPVGESKNDYEIFSILSDKLGFWEDFTGSRTADQWLSYFLKNSEIDDVELFKREGIYKAPDQGYVGLSGFIKDPDSNPLQTPSGKIEVEIEAFKPLGGTVLPEAVIMKTSMAYPLRLITPHEKYRIHSQFDNIESFKNLPDRFLWLNTLDADKRGIESLEIVRVISETGEMEVTVKVTDAIAQGVVSLNQGGWAFVNGNPNSLTSTEPTKPSNGSRTHSTAVQVEKLQGKAGLINSKTNPG